MSKKKSAQKNPLPKQPDSKKVLLQHSKKGESRSGDIKKQWIALSVLALVVFIVFFPSLKCEFTNWDDGTYVTENPLIWKLDAEHVKNIFINPPEKRTEGIFSWLTPVSLNYHPLTILSLAFDYKFGKLDPYMYHLVNVLIHILNALLLFIFIRKFVEAYNRRTSVDAFRPTPFMVALITASLWAIHPMRVESVTWVAERKDVLYFFFFFLSAIFYLRHKEEQKTKWMALCFCMFVCSCLSKGMGVVLPAVLVLIDWFYGEPRSVKEIFRSIVSKWYFFLTSFAFGVIAFEIQSHGAIAAMGTFTLFQRLTFGCYGFIMYIWKLFVPVNLSAFYPYPFTDAQGNIPGIYYAAPFIVLLIALAGVFVLKRKPLLGKILVFGLAFYFITVALVLQFISVGSVIIADRYTYLSYVGLLFSIGYFYEYVKKSFQPVFSSFYAIVLISSSLYFAYLTHERTKVWTNAETLWTDAMNQFPFIEMAYENRGIYYKDHNQLDKMLKDYEFVTEKLHSRNEKIWSNLGNLYGLLKQFDKSLAAYSTAIEINPENASTYLNRAITYSMMGQYAKAVPDFDKALELGPNVALTYKNRAYTLMQLGQFDKCVSDYNKAIELNPYDTLSFLNRGIALFNAKQYSESLSDFKKYISMAPNNAQAYFNASIAFKNLNLFPEAIQYASSAQKLGQQISPQYMQELLSKVKKE